MISFSGNLLISQFINIRFKRKTYDIEIVGKKNLKERLEL